MGMEFDGSAGGALVMIVGLVLVLLGATGATLTQRRFEQEGRAQHALLWLVPFGVLVGAGAAMVRGWDLVGSMLLGAALVPLVGAVSRLLEVRRRKRREGR